VARQRQHSVQIGDLSIQADVLAAGSKGGVTGRMVGSHRMSGRECWIVGVASPKDTWYSG